MKLVLVQEHGRATRVASVCDTLEELLAHPFALSPSAAPPRVHKVAANKCKPAATLMRVIRQQTRVRAYVTLPIV